MCSACRPTARTEAMTADEDKQRQNLIGNIERGIWSLNDDDHERITTALKQANDWATVARLWAELNTIDPPTQW